MGSVRMAARAAIRYQFRWFTGWIGTKDNRLVNALSRSQWDLIDRMVDLSAKIRHLIPFEVVTLWLTEKQDWHRLVRL